MWQSIVDFFSTLFSKDSHPQPVAIPQGEAPKVTPPWLAIAMEEIGQKEIPGPQNNPRIIEYHATTKLKGATDEIPWCSAFVNWCMAKAGYRNTGSAMARSWLEYGDRLLDPVYGCIVILKRGDSTWQGHVTFFVQAGSEHDTIKCLGGNQHNSVCISEYNRGDVLGYVWPKKSDKL